MWKVIKQICTLVIPLNKQLNFNNSNLVVDGNWSYWKLYCTTYNSISAQHSLY